jgi:hypothetical protein
MEMNDFITEHEKTSLSLKENSIQEIELETKKYDPSQFRTGTNEAFIELGALKPDYNWSMFDVDDEKAKHGQAKNWSLLSGIFTALVKRQYSVIDKTELTGIQ